jgi:HAD superfamily hydrolase (TIGR01509 family)
VIAGLQLTARPDALLLDVGDTLLFFDGHAVSDALAAQGVALAAERIDGALHEAKQSYRRHVGQGRDHEGGWFGLMRDLLVLAGLSREQAEPLLPGLRRVHDELYFWRRVPPELPAALERARAGGLRLGVVSNSEGRLVSVLQRLGLFSQFELIIDSAIEGVQKPDPEIFRRALARLGVAAERALYAGDMPEVDVSGARAAGMQGVLVDPLGHYASEPEWPRVASVAVLIDELLGLASR